MIRLAGDGMDPELTDLCPAVRCLLYVVPLINGWCIYTHEEPFQEHDTQNVETQLIIYLANIGDTYVLDITMEFGPYMCDACLRPIGLRCCRRGTLSAGACSCEL